METCTVTALDAITAFAVPNPNCPSQSRRFFQVWLRFGLPRFADHSAYFGLAKFYLSQPFQPSTGATLEICSKIVNARFRCNWQVVMNRETETQPVESLALYEREIKFFPISPQKHPQALKATTASISGRFPRFATGGRKTVCSRFLKERQL